MSDVDIDLEDRLPVDLVQVRNAIRCLARAGGELLQAKNSLSGVSNRFINPPDLVNMYGIVVHALTSSFFRSGDRALRARWGPGSDPEGFLEQVVRTSSAYYREEVSEQLLGLVPAVTQVSQLRAIGRRCIGEGEDCLNRIARCFLGRNPTVIGDTLTELPLLYCTDGIVIPAKDDGIPDNTRSGTRRSLSGFEIRTAVESIFWDRMVDSGFRNSIRSKSGTVNELTGLPYPLAEEFLQRLTGEPWSLWEFPEDEVRELLHLDGSRFPTNLPGYAFAQGRGTQAFLSRFSHDTETRYILRPECAHKLKVNMTGVKEVHLYRIGMTRNFVVTDARRTQALVYTGTEEELRTNEVDRLFLPVRMPVPMQTSSADVLLINGEVVRASGLAALRDFGVPLGTSMQSARLRNHDDSGAQLLHVRVPVHQVCMTGLHRLLPTSVLQEMSRLPKGGV